MAINDVVGEGCIISGSSGPRTLKSKKPKNLKTFSKKSSFFPALPKSRYSVYHLTAAESTAVRVCSRCRRP